ncbi:MAG: hypothetical protein DI586_00285 [Micavibrio aeruginosavorus]|uniref:Uncharacterized protein n=1 Tax=Micavibrio aeruginosavorus TaxID=349221 RepID=A0A2W5FR69_9BACT|nr:MAG: hypothetical protein DI586_00285 [Micavibrio aeruginosavorus]
MKRTAYFHPAFAEELSLLTPDARIHFYSLALRDAMSHFNRDRYCNYVPEDDSTIALRFVYSILYLQVTPVPKTCMSVNQDVMRDANLYLHLAVQGPDKDKAEFDRELIAKSRERMREIKDSKFEPVGIDAFCDLHADQIEVNEARRINLDMGQRDFYRNVMILAFEDAKKEIGDLFNLSPLQITRMIKRFDRFLEFFNNCLEKRWGGQVSLNVRYRDDEVFIDRSFFDLTSTTMSGDFEPEKDGD